MIMVLMYTVNLYSVIQKIFKSYVKFKNIHQHTFKVELLSFKFLTFFFRKQVKVILLPQVKIIFIGLVMIVDYKLTSKLK